MKRLVSMLLILAMMFALPLANANTKQVSAEEVNSGAIEDDPNYLGTITYDGENAPVQTAKFTNTKLLMSVEGKEILVQLDEVNISYNNGNDCICWLAPNNFRFDSYGTLWIECVDNVFWLNYQIDGDNLTPHYWDEGIFYADINDPDGKYVAYYGLNSYIPLPTLDELRNSLLPASSPSPTPIVTQSPNPTPVATSRPSQTVTPVVTNPPSRTFMPVVSPNDTPTITSTATPTPKEEANQTVSTEISKVKSGRNSTKLCTSAGKAIKQFKFNKKTGVLTYKTKKVKKVKVAYFTKKGSIIYVTKNNKAYYLNGKKSKLIKKNVVSVKTSKKFAVVLKLKNGKTFKLTK